MEPDPDEYQLRIQQMRLKRQIDDNLIALMHAVEEKLSFDEDSGEKDKPLPSFIHYNSFVNYLTTK